MNGINMNEILMKGLLSDARRRSPYFTTSMIDRKGNTLKWDDVISYGVEWEKEQLNNVVKLNVEDKKRKRI
jgi:hypothetical protein